MTSKTFPLNTGAAIPAIGLGTWQSAPNEVDNAVVTALQTGYRHIDTALAYGNEKEVGQAIKDSGVPRKNIWVTTKLHPRWMHRVNEGIDTSLRDSGPEYVDLYRMGVGSQADSDGGAALAGFRQNMVRFPLLFAFPPRASPDIPSPLRVRNIGVSHSAIHNLETPLTHPSLKTVPRANQIELHPSNPSPKLVAYCRTHSIHCTGYSCLGSTNSPLYKDATLLQLAEKKGKTPQQCLLMWGLQKGWSVIPKSVNAERVEENCELDGWGLDKGEMEALDGLEGRFEVCADGWLPAKVFLGDDE